MSGLSAEEVQFYQKNGYISPINILSEKEATSFHEELQSIESKYGSDLTGLGRNNTHQVIPFIDQLAHNPKILDVVQSIIGPKYFGCWYNIIYQRAGTSWFYKLASRRQV